MGQTEQSIQTEEQANKYKERLARKMEKQARFANEMKASSTFQKMFVWLKFKWADSILFYVTLIITGSILIVAARILWEVAKIVFNVSL